MSSGPLDYWRVLRRLFPDLGCRRQDLSAGNSTLGFGAILTVSANSTSDTAWRKEGLIAAANKTGLDIQIPIQPVFSKKEVVRLTHSTSRIQFQRPKVGNALAWLGHVHILKSFLQTDLTTALIIEDDSDWDLSIRQQTLPLATAIRNLTSPNITASTSPGPYGLAWDLLWIGHCGDNWRDSPSQTTYPDPTLIPASSYRGFYHDGMPPATRLVHYSTAPVCSFAYAVTRHGAQKIIDWAADERTGAYDLQLGQGCFYKHLTCLTSNPELIHHHREGGHGYSQIDGANGVNRVLKHDYTWNVKYSARCNSRKGKEGEELTQCLPRPEDT
ncbi:hypothetical protein MMC24_007402 [Lignoscripta atroalba]|nr:hypothetical protein [Lignoscripta atroalba]